MANLKSSKKDIRNIAKRTARNRSVRSKLKTLAKNVLRLSTAGDHPAAKTMAQEYISALDRAAKVKVIHPNKADRHKSTFSKYLVPQA